MLQPFVCDGHLKGLAAKKEIIGTLLLCIQVEESRKLHPSPPPTPPTGQPLPGSGENQSPSEIPLIMKMEMDMDALFCQLTQNSELWFRSQSR